MKRLALILCLLAIPTQAQQIPPAAEAYRLVAHQCVEREAAALAEIVGLRAQIDALTKERDAPKMKPDAPKETP
jgi:hypothetical protein